MARSPHRAALAALLALAAALAGCTQNPTAATTQGPDDAAYRTGLTAILGEVAGLEERAAAAADDTARAEVYAQGLPQVRAAQGRLASLAPPAAWTQAHEAFQVWLRAVEGQYASGIDCAAGDEPRCAEHHEFVRLAGEALHAAMAAMPPEA